MNIRSGQILGVVFTMVSIDAACAGIVRPSVLSSPAEAQSALSSTGPIEQSSLVSLFTRDVDHVGVATFAVARQASAVIAEDANPRAASLSRQSMAALGSSFPRYNGQQPSGAATNELLFRTAERGIFTGERPYENLYQNSVTKLSVAASDWTLYGNYLMSGQATGSATLPSFGNEPGEFSSVPLPPAAYPAFALAGVFAMRALSPRRK
ncbi:MAG: hypothetical protein JSR77_11690 [Planctomycetes bacterium]|nr:hypothetical protein [Planctomycetota bacterium]